MNRAEAAGDPAAAIRSDGVFRILENDHMRVAVAPGLGGKFVSLWSKRTGTEWLLPPLRPHAEAKASAGFDAWDGGGFDECLPTVASTDSAPDHGEVWRQAWQEEAAADGSLILRTTALAGSIRVERRACLDGATLILDYSIKNRSDTPRSLLYSAHPLLRIEQGDRILLPKEVRSVRIEGSAGDRLGRRGDRIDWPMSSAGMDLSVVGPPDGQQADKLFAGPVTVGWCALLRPDLDEGLELTFSNGALPHLGLWICRAAWPESGAAKQYAVAFEPTSSPCDSLADAEQQGTAWVLGPGQRREWRLCFRLTSQQELEARRGAQPGGSR